MSYSSVFVDAHWLRDNLNKPTVKVLYTRLADIQTGAVESTIGSIIPNAQLFDFEAEFADHDSPYPHTLPSNSHIERELRRLGLNERDHVVIYDSKGMYSVARVWWMLRSIGHQYISILQGGLPSWLDNNFDVEDELKTVYPTSDYQISAKPNQFVDTTYLLTKIQDPQTIIIDARAKGRFEGSVAEPRPGVRSGRIPGSKNLPFLDIVKEGCLLDVDSLKHSFESLGVTPSCHLIMTCGSGVTACILALAGVLCGYENVSVYDGSWSEWGSVNTLPIERGEIQ